MIDLYHSPISTCSQKVRLALAEKRLNYVDHVVDLSKLEHLSADYLKLNPNGVVPTITHDGNPVVDSSVICEYIDEVFPLPPLSPPSALGRAHMRAWLRYIEEIPTVAVRVPSINKLFAKSLSNMGESAFEAMRSRTPLRKHFFAKLGKEGFDATETAQSMEQLRSSLERVDVALKDGPWLVGQSFSIADIAYIPTVVRMEDLGLSTLWADLPRVSDWFSRVQARPSFSVAYYPGCRIDRNFRFAMRSQADDE